MEVNITALEESKKSVYFLVMGNMFYKRDKVVPHSHVMGIGFVNKANGRLGVNGAV